MLRLTVCVHEATEATHAARFPLPGDPLSRVGARAAGGRPPLECTRVLVAPELRARESARAYGLAPDANPDAAATPAATPAPPRKPDPAADPPDPDHLVVPEFADLDVGRWAGTPMDSVPPAELMAWLTDPGFDAHGGESLEALRARVEARLAAIDDGPPTALVAHPSTARIAVLAALGAPTAAFWRVDLGPGHRLRLHRRAGRWTLRF